MSFLHLIRKTNARSQLEKFNERTAVVLFDPKTAYEHLVDQRRVLQKEYQDGDLKAVNFDQIIEDARKKATRARDDRYEHGEEYPALGPQYASPIAPEEDEEGNDMAWKEGQWLRERPGGETPHWAREE